MKGNIMKKNILLSLALFLGLATLGQETVAGRVFLMLGRHLPRLQGEELFIQAPLVAPIDDEAGLIALIAGRIIQSNQVGNPGTLRDIIPENLILTNHNGLHEVKNQLNHGHVAPIMVEVRPGAVIRANPAAGHPHDFPEPAL
jgi:hypothetical protein